MYAPPPAYGLWKTKLKLNDVILINGITFKIVRKEAVFRPTSLRPATPGTKNETSKTEVGEGEGEDNEEEEDNEIKDDDDEETIRRKEERKKKKQADLSGLEELVAKSGAVMVVDKWAAEPPTMPEINVEDFTSDHIALDRPWVLPDAQNLQVSTCNLG